LRESGPERDGVPDDRGAFGEEIRNPCKAALDFWQSDRQPVGVADYEIEYAPYGRIAMGLGIGAPALEVALLQQAGAQHRKKSAPVEPVVAGESGLRQMLGGGQRPLHQHDMTAVGLPGVFPQ
jgi:hypothetical protein